jgi:hypothetical protein
VTPEIVLQFRVTRPVLGKKPPPPDRRRHAKRSIKSMEIMPFPPWWPACLGGEENRSKKSEINVDW